MKIGNWELCLSACNLWKDIFNQEVKFNWFTFTLINFYIEVGTYKGKYFECGFVFFNFYVNFEIYEIQTRDKFIKRADNILENYMNKKKEG